MKVICYARCSTVHQNPENQLNELRTAAERYGWTILKEYIDHGVSGKKGREQRPQFNAMMNSALRKEADLVMFWGIDRASRNLSHLVEMMSDLHSKNVGMYFHQQNIDSTTPSGRAMLSMAGVFAQFESEMLRERILASHERAKSEGKTIGRPSMINEALKTSIRYMREQGVGIKKIASELNVGVGTVYKVIRAETFTV
jgi:DNA invertase Pin-like site-specific DNA recombinase